jgi:hypothetical protein
LTNFCPRHSHGGWEEDIESEVEDDLQIKDGSSFIANLSTGLNESGSAVLLASGVSSEFCDAHHLTP